MRNSGCADQTTTGEGVKDVWRRRAHSRVRRSKPFRCPSHSRSQANVCGAQADWIAANVEAPGKVRPSERDIKGLAENMRLAETLGAETVVLSGHKQAKKS